MVITAYAGSCAIGLAWVVELSGHMCRWRGGFGIAHRCAGLWVRNLQYLVLPIATGLHLHLGHCQTRYTFAERDSNISLWYIKIRIE